MLIGGIMINRNCPKKRTTLRVRNKSIDTNILTYLAHPYYFGRKWVCFWRPLSTNCVDQPGYSAHIRWQGYNWMAIFCVNAVKNEWNAGGT